MALEYSISGDAWCPAFDSFPRSSDWICKVLFKAPNSLLTHNICLCTSDQQWPHQFEKADSVLHRDAGFMGELSHTRFPPTEMAVQAVGTAWLTWSLHSRGPRARGVLRHAMHTCIPFLWQYDSPCLVISVCLLTPSSYLNLGKNTPGYCKKIKYILKPLEKI